MNNFITALGIKNVHVSSNQILILNAFVVITIFAFIVACITGSINISLRGLFSSSLDELSRVVLIEIRLPRVILAGLVGASLGISGAALQGLFRNPLADPGLIGVSAGAALGATLVIVLGSNFVGNFALGSFLLPLGAILGAMSVILLLYFLTKGFGYQGVTYMLLVGIAVNAIAGVGIGILTFISTDSELRGLTFWTMGSFGGVTWPLLIPAILIIVASISLMMTVSRNLDLIQLGEPEAYRWALM